MTDHSHNPNDAESAFRRILPMLDDLGLPDALPQAREALVKASTYDRRKQEAPDQLRRLAVDLARKLVDGHVTEGEAADRMVMAQLAQAEGSHVDQMLQFARGFAVLDAYAVLRSEGDDLIRRVLAPAFDKVLGVAVDAFRVLPDEVRSQEVALHGRPEVRRAWGDLVDASARADKLHRVAATMRDHGVVPSIDCHPTAYQYRHPENVQRVKVDRVLRLPIQALAGAEPAILTTAEVQALVVASDPNAKHLAGKQKAMQRDALERQSEALAALAGGV